ncbi:MAG: helix-turn-helix domain-containing protein [Aigarchaeota archaeon]|nr:helix-turn-helix domain-containing protein [Aigarchaeota archaeon]MDW8093259.1 helix-turn-helix domain-containing protein [Nitrososphaerota archaeon]
MAEGSTEDIEELIWLLRHKVRRNIVVAVGDAGKISATTLRDQLDISTGSLYYNLRQLERLVRQDQSRSYVLTDEGVRIYKLLKEKGDVSMSELRVPQSRTVNVIYSIFSPIWLIGPILDRAKVGLIAGIVLQALLAGLMINAKTSLILLHVYHRGADFSIPDYLSTTAITIVAAYLYMSVTAFAYSALRSRIMEEKTETNRSVLRELLNVVISDGSGHKLLAGIMIGISPMALYPGVVFLDRILGTGLFNNQTAIPTSIVPSITLIVSQLISFFVMTACFSYVRRVPWYVAALITFSFIYISITVQYMVFSL